MWINMNKIMFIGRSLFKVCIIKGVMLEYVKYYSVF